MLYKKLTILMAAAVLLAAAALAVDASTKHELKKGTIHHGDTSPKIAIAYVEYFRKGTPDPDMFTHLIYSAVEFNDNNDGITIPTLEKLKSLAELKKKNPDLKVMISVAGPKREGFSEMARDKKKRKAFALSVKNVLDSLCLDGVDLDWEFPGTEGGGHTASAHDARNYVAVVKDLRKTLGKKKWISFYASFDANYIDLKGMVPYVDYVNMSGYNLSIPKDNEPRSYHQSPLYPSKKISRWSIKDAVELNIEKGVPPEKLLIGIPFYGRGRAPFPSYLDCSSFSKYTAGTQLLWDDDAKVPYYADKDGNLLMGFDNERSIEEKMNFVRTNNLPGVFVWNYDSDYDDHRLGRTIERLRK